MGVVKRIGNGLRKRRGEFSELFQSVPKARRYAASPGGASRVFYVSENHMRGLLSHVFFLDHLRRFGRHPDDGRNRAYNRWIDSHFEVEGGRPVFRGQGFRLEMPEEFPNARDVVTNDLREILLENRYSCMFPGGRLANPGDVVLDCGANIGAFAVAAALSAPDVRVIAFEPEPATFRALSHNVEINGLGSRVRCLQFGVTDKEAEYTLRTHQSCFTMHRLEDPGHALGPGEQGGDRPGDVVHCVTIDRVVRDSGFDRCDVIKMDIEGAERVALAGAAETIRRYRPRLTIAAYHKASDPFTLSVTIKEICDDYNVIVTPEGHLYAFV